ncbi:hypothetical protein [Algibacter sp. Ld11]|uniref:hypothetical protein n=1 Tax=Algibacter sp. Ld11 TaxID=649150 RepID=UPI003870DB27
MGFANLAPSKKFTLSFKNINVLSKNIQVFNKNIKMHSKINTLSGTAYNFAVDIRDRLVPKLETIGSDLEASLNVAQMETKAFGEHMIQLCDVLQKPQVDITLLKGAFSTAIAQSNLINKTIKEGITNDLDLYEQQLNKLISELGSEKLAIKDDDQLLKNMRNEIIQKIKARTHTVSGVIETIWDAVTFQLEDKLKADERALAQIQLQYNANSIAIGAATSIVGSVKNFVNELDNQNRFWDNLSSLLLSLETDIHALVDTHDKDIASLYIDLVETDWAAIKNIK